MVRVHVWLLVRRRFASKGHTLLTEPVHTDDPCVGSKQQHGTARSRRNMTAAGPPWTGMSTRLVAPPPHKRPPLHRLSHPPTSRPAWERVDGDATAMDAIVAHGPEPFTPTRSNHRSSLSCSPSAPEARTRACNRHGRPLDPPPPAPLVLSCMAVANEPGPPCRFCSLQPALLGIFARISRLIPWFGPPCPISSRQG